MQRKAEQNAEEVMWDYFKRQQAVGRRLRRSSGLPAVRVELRQHNPGTQPGMTLSAVTGGRPRDTPVDVR
jgi:hypothetical protein